MSTTSDHPLADAFHELQEDLSRELSTLREANAELRRVEGEALRRYAQAVDDIVDRLEADLAEQRTALDEEKEEAATELREAVDDLLDRAHRAVDELRVQEHLAELEVRDLIRPRWEALTAALGRLQGKLRDT